MSQAEKQISPATADRTGTIVKFPIEAATGSAAMELARDYGGLRDQVIDLGVNVVEGHLRALHHEWRERTARKTPRAVADLLEELSDEHGFAWTAIAKLLGVTVQSLRNWRRGEAISGENRSKLAGLVAYLDMLRSQAGIEDPASWMEVPILPGIPLTPIDAYLRGELPLLLELACGRVAAEAVLSAIDPDWRTKYDQSTWEVFEAEDGNLSIRSRSAPR